MKKAVGVLAVLLGAAWARAAARRHAERNERGPGRERDVYPGMLRVYASLDQSRDS